MTEKDNLQGFSCLEEPKRAVAYDRCLSLEAFDTYKKYYPTLKEKEKILKGVIAQGLILLLDATAFIPFPSVMEGMVAEAARTNGSRNNG